MREHKVTLPELALLAGTRVVLGAGLGLLFAGWLNDDQRKAAGWALLGVGRWPPFPSRWMCSAIQNRRQGARQGDW